MYKKNLVLNHNEAALIIDKETGEVREVTVSNNPDMMKHDKGMLFKKFYSEGWDLLQTQTTDKEYIVATKLAHRVRMFNNSLQPLGPELTATQLAEELHEDRRTIVKRINRLLQLGVIATFSVADTKGVTRKYWLFNPFLVFNGRVIKKEIAYLFKDTFYVPKDFSFPEN